MIDTYSQRIDWDSIAKTAQPAMQPDKNGTWAKLVDHVRRVSEIESRRDKLAEALQACQPALDLAMEQAHPRQKDHWHKLMVQADEALTVCGWIKP